MISSSFNIWLILSIIIFQNIIDKFLLIISIEYWIMNRTSIFKYRLIFPFSFIYFIISILFHIWSLFILYSLNLLRNFWSSNLMMNQLRLVMFNLSIRSFESLMFAFPPTHFLGISSTRIFWGPWSGRK